ncbi:unnamed protein product [Dimorphilus gyrociliatus]|uniref:Uncharacterized protein n=1 Tax=Dimorphilus gyrociliatus TaxID=2664684 RepID=A0A7I8WDU2_9ANNE|nr:unnamed protein product [Dimorphilus gyrociliatus]
MANVINNEKVSVFCNYCLKKFVFQVECKQHVYCCECLSESNDSQLELMCSLCRLQRSLNDKVIGNIKVDLSNSSTNKLVNNRAICKNHENGLIYCCESCYMENTDQSTPHRETTAIDDVSIEINKRKKNRELIENQLRIESESLKITLAEIEMSKRELLRTFQKKFEDIKINARMIFAQRNTDLNLLLIDKKFCRDETELKNHLSKHFNSRPKFNILSDFNINYLLENERDTIFLKQDGDTGGILSPSLNVIDNKTVKLNDKRCNTLRLIDLSYNLSMGNIVANFSNGILKSSRTLREINLERCCLTESQVMYIGKILENHLLFEKSKLLQYENEREHSYIYSFEDIKEIQFSCCYLTNDHVEKIGNIVIICENIQKVDLSKNEKMGNGLSSILQALLKSSKSLKQINLSMCSMAKSQGRDLGNLLEKCSNIENIDLSWNTSLAEEWIAIFKGLRASSSTLKEVNLSSCSLDEKYGKFIGEVLNDCNNIEEINLSWNKEMKSQLSFILNCLSKSSNTLKVVDISWNYLLEEHGNSIGEIFQQYSNIQVINLSGNKQLENGWSAICNGLLKSVNCLRDIDISSCELGENCGRSIGNLLENCSNVEIFNISWNKHLDNDLLAICKGLVNSANTLTDIDFQYCYLTESQGNIIGNMLNSCTNLNTVDFSSNIHVGRGLSRICDGLLQSSNTLTSISLNMCNIKEDVAYSIANLLQKCSKIEILALSRNYKMGNGFLSICDSLLKSTESLKEIHFSWCFLTEKQANTLGKTLEYFQNISKVNLSGNKKLLDELQTIFNGLSKCYETLQEINLSKCNLDEQQCVYLGDMIAKCSNIHKMNLSENMSMGNGLSNICKSFSKSSQTFKEILLSSCKLTEDDGKSVGQLITTCPKLEKIDLSNNPAMGEGLSTICKDYIKSTTTLSDGNENRNANLTYLTWQ